MTSQFVIVNIYIYIYIYIYTYKCVCVCRDSVNAYVTQENRSVLCNSHLPPSATPPTNRNSRMLRLLRRTMLDGWKLSGRPDCRCLPDRRWPRMHWPSEWVTARRRLCPAVKQSYFTARHRDVRSHFVVMRCDAVTVWFGDAVISVSHYHMPITASYNDGSFHKMQQ